MAADAVGIALEGSGRAEKWWEANVSHSVLEVIIVLLAGLSLGFAISRSWVLLFLFFGLPGTSSCYLDS